MSRENILFGAGLIVIVGALTISFLWISQGQPEEKRQTGEMKNTYLIGLPDDTTPATQAATATQPDLPIAQEPPAQ